MSLHYFICPDGNQVETKSCLEKCRLESRCLTKSTLQDLSAVRETFDNPSVTQLLNGPRYEYLKHKHPYAQSPDDMAFAYLGTRAHAALEAATHDRGINEERLFNGFTTGKFDNLEFDGQSWSLTDYKTYGSWKVNKILQEGDAGLELQLNMLRILIEKRDPVLHIDGIPVDHIAKLYVQIIVRDGGLWIAKKNGIPWKMRRLEVPILPDNLVENYFQQKRSELVTALQSDAMPRICNAEESWDGRRCEEYCPVSSWCKKHGDNPYLK